jgi:hypothetical protein
MDRTLLEEYLVEAERHVALGRRHITRQKELIAALERGGRDTTSAKALLTTFEEIEGDRVAERDRVARRLAQVAR